MPVYLVHGFKWPRPLIRIHIILQNLDDAAAEWLVSPGTTACMLDNFHSLFPDQMKHLPNLRFVEQFDPTDESTTTNAPSQPFAYVADICQEVKLGIDIDEFRGKGVGGDQWSALMELRDKIAPEERPGWFVVVCGDEERWAPPTIETLQQAGQHNGVRRADSETAGSVYSHRPSSERKAASRDGELRGLKKLFGGFSRRKSQASMNGSSSQDKQHQPPVPSPPKSADKPPQLPVYGNSRTVSTAPPGAIELSTCPPTRAGDESSTPRSVSPIEEEPSSTPGTEYSVSSSRRRRSDSSTYQSRDVSPIEVRRAKSQLDRLRGVSPVTVRAPSPLSRQQQPSDIPDRVVKTDPAAPAPLVHVHHPERQNSGRKRRSLQKPQVGGPACYHPPMTATEVAGADNDGVYEVITMTPRSTTPGLTRLDSKKRRSVTSPIKERSSMDTYKPKGSRFPVNPSGQSRRDSKGADVTFGQKLNQFDLVANNIETALNGMR